MKLRVTRRAFADREQIRNYLAKESSQAARTVTSRLDEAIDRLARQPHLGTQTDVDDVSVIFVGRYPYKIFYRVHLDEVQILHIRHTARVVTDLENMA